MSERKYVAISIKHTIYRWKFGKPCTLWGYRRTSDNEPRCFGGYTERLSDAELYTFDDMKNHGYDGTICRQEPVKMSYDFCTRWRRYDTVLMHIDEYRNYCKAVGIDTGETDIKEDIETKKFPDWIKCSERLPEYHKDVLVYTPHTGVTTAFFDFEDIPKFKEFWYSAYDGDPLPDQFVTHWMPCPKNPEDDKDGSD